MGAMMQIAARLLAGLGDGIEAIKEHLSTIDDETLRAFLVTMQGKSLAESAEMTMTILIYRKMEIRKRDHNVLAFPVRT